MDSRFIGGNVKVYKGVHMVLSLDKGHVILIVQ